MIEKIDEFIEFVNNQIQFHTERVNLYAGSNRAKKHQETREGFIELKQLLLSFAEFIRKKDADTREIQHQLTLSLDPSDLDSLPEELINELSISKADKFEYIILTVIEELGGFASLDQLLVSLYKQTKLVHKRTQLTNRLYRMVQKGLIHSVPDKKGVYSLKEFKTGKLDKILSEAKARRKVELAS